MSEPEFFDRREAAKFLTDCGMRISDSTLAKRAIRGDSPPFSIFGKRAIYRKCDLIEWMRFDALANTEKSKAA
jgi:hypothetical protein